MKNLHIMLFPIVPAILIGFTLNDKKYRIKTDHEALANFITYKINN